jgi:geranylgeranyl diphosphate synthase type II
MDNDDLRRGRPTCHKVFGEAIAILAGDSLSAHAFTLLSKSGTMDVITEVAHNIGTYGLVGGQVVDIESEGKDISPEELTYIHRNKTAALIRTSLKVGAMVAEAPSQIIRALDEYGDNIGMAFQIVDDILDIKGTEEELGKPIGSDDKKNKATYPRLFGLDESYEKARQHTEKAKDALPTSTAPRYLLKLADFI